MSNREFAQEHKISKRAAAKILNGHKRSNPRSPFFGLTQEKHLELVQERPPQVKAN